MAAKKKRPLKLPLQKSPGKERKAPAAKKQRLYREAYSKTQILTEIAETTGLAKKQVQGVLDELNGLIARHLGKKALVNSPCLA